MFIIVKPIHHSRLPANTFYKLDKYILQFGQMHFTIWEGGMIIISKANSSVAPPAGKEEFHHFFTELLCRAFWANTAAVSSQIEIQKNHPILLPGCSADLFQPRLQCPCFWNLFIGHFDSILCYTHFFTIICLALWGFIDSSGFCGWNNLDVFGFF